MSSVGGPISTLPGALLKLPNNVHCDEHEDRLATKRVQGETDSFGYEACDMCQECYDKYLSQVEMNKNDTEYCDWCKTYQNNTQARRDFEEGSSGPVYQICPDCWKKHMEYVDDNY